MIKNYLFVFILIILLGTFLRIWQLDKLPVSLFGDEIDVGIHAYSILKTGKDYYGNTFPVMFKSFSESRLPLPIYTAVPFIAIFGLNEWGVRLGMVIVGILGLLGLFLLSKELFNTKIGLIATFLLAISPWHIQYSRQANDAGAVLTLTLFAIWLFIKGLNNYLLILLSAFIFGLAFYAYSIATIFIPLFGLSLLLIYRKKVFKFNMAKLFVAALVFLVTVTPYIYFTFIGLSQERFSKVSIEADHTLIDEIIKRRAQTDSPIAPIFQNKNTVLISETVKNYLKSYSTDFLFVNGDPNLRHSIGGFGELFWFSIPLLLTGFIVLIAGIKKNIGISNLSFFLVGVWLIISPVPSSLTRDGAFHASRLILLLPALTIISALGLNYLLEIRKRFFVKILIIGILLMGILNISGYAYRYIVEWPIDSWKFWNDGFKEALLYTKSVEGDYERVYFNNTYEPTLPRFLFWYSYDPALFQGQFKGFDYVINESSGFRGFKLGEKYYFGEIPQPYQKLVSENYLLVASARDDILLQEWLEDPNVKLLKTVYSPSREPIFYILTGNKLPEK